MVGIQSISNLQSYGVKCIPHPTPFTYGLLTLFNSFLHAAINCDAPEVSPEDLEKYDVVSTACMLGDMAATGAVTCTLSYTIPATPLPDTVDASQIVAAITYADLAENVVEDSSNNAAATCVTAPAMRQV